MWLVIKYSMSLVLLCIGLGETTYIIGPKFIQPNRDYTAAVVNIHNSSEMLLLRLIGMDLQGRPLFNLTKTMYMTPYTNKMITFRIPSNITIENFAIITVGHAFYKEFPLEYRSLHLSGLIQLNKPVFSPGDKLMFRVIVTDENLKPLKSHETKVSIFVKDPKDNVIGQWNNNVQL
ncbi:CD109 antigen-like [Anopheles darlingi]|uniref:CD109 antigen-like n=1 Tax=Anopheles darlingi TaxID=43151 RepID=UPI0021000A72|nr:CD109 antigen-like [Anopheles darlingi]